MPKKYESIRDDLIKKGYGRKKAEEIAARTYNKQRKPGQRPVGRHKK